jgi:hypothetical protein
MAWRGRRRLQQRPPGHHPTLKRDILHLRWFVKTHLRPPKLGPIRMATATAMQSVYYGNQPMHRISTATPKTRSPQHGHGHAHATLSPMMAPGLSHGGLPVWVAPPAYYGQAAPYTPIQPMNQLANPNNTTLFVSGLSGYVTEDELCFQGYGEITYAKVPTH